jgi:hypothetical protein
MFYLSGLNSGVDVAALFLRTTPGVQIAADLLKTILIDQKISVYLLTNLLIDELRAADKGIYSGGKF